jgi:hypothetical protein
VAANYYATYKRFNGVDWDTFYFSTVASQVAETSTRKWLTDVQQGWLNDYLNPANFNTNGHLVKLDPSTGLIPFSSVPANLGYLYLTGGQMSGGIDMNGNNVIDVAKLYGQPTVDLALGLGTTDYLTLKYHVSSPYLQMAYYLDMSNKKISNLAEPTVGTDAATRQFVEQLVAQGTHVIDAARVASTANVTTLSGTITVDGTVLAVDDRVLLKNQTTASENGVYIVNAGAWTKLPDASDVGSLVFVLEGTANGSRQFYCNTENAWVLYFIQASYFATIGDGLEVDGTGFGFGIKASSVTNAMLAGSIANDKLLAIAESKISAFAGADGGSVVAATTSYGLSSHMKNIYAMIKSIKGTAGAHTAQTDTISSLNFW